ncbi:MAG: hypothetical protein J6Z01_06495 [Bacteroidales bacterium]|nr:hypothetical protein [Bacteroidales bacterium]
MAKVFKHLPPMVLMALIIAAAFCTGCKFDDAENQQKIDSLRNDSIQKAQLLKIDTCTAYFRRHTWADKKHNITFDRIEILSDSAAIEYAATRHGFEGRKNIVINLEPTTATMAITDSTEILVVNPAFKSGKSKTHYIKGTVTNITDFEYNTIIKIATQNKNILYLQQLDIEL